MFLVSCLIWIAVLMILRGMEVSNPGFQPFTGRESPDMLFLFTFNFCKCSYDTEDGKLQAYAKYFFNVSDLLCE